MVVLSPRDLSLCLAYDTAVGTLSSLWARGFMGASLLKVHLSLQYWILHHGGGHTGCRSQQLALLQMRNRGVRASCQAPNSLYWEQYHKATVRFFFFLICHFSHIILSWYTVFLFYLRNSPPLSLSLSFFFFGCMACGMLVPWPGIKPVPTAMKAWSPNHWTIRKAPTIHSSAVVKERINSEHCIS